MIFFRKIYPRNETMGTVSVLIEVLAISIPFQEICEVSCETEFLFRISFTRIIRLYINFKI